MRNIISTSVSSTLRVAWQRNHKNWLAILTYHRVADSYNPQIHLPNGWSQTQKFEQHIRFLSSKYNIVPLHDALCDLEANNLHGQCIAITMDDGDHSVKSHAIPILEKYNCPATFFITSAYLNCKTLHFSIVVRYLANSQNPQLSSLITDEYKNAVKTLRTTNDPKEYLDIKEQIETLSKHIADKQNLFLTKDDLLSFNPKLFHIGLHGHEHQRFSMMSTKWQSDAISKNIDALICLENYRPIFALPFGAAIDWNQDTLQTCLDHNVIFLTCNGGINMTKSAEYSRIFADGSDITYLLTKEMTGIL